MTQSYTSDLDPYRRHRQLEQLTQVFAGLGQQRKQKKQQEEERARRRAQLALSAVSDGSLESDSMSARRAIEGLRKYDSEEADLFLNQLDVFGANRKKALDAEEANRLIMERVYGGAEQERLDALDAPRVNDFFGDQAVPLPETFDIGSALQGSLNQQPVPDQIQARKTLGIDSPYLFDQNRPGAVTPELRGQIAGEQGLIPPESARHARIAGDLEPGVSAELAREKEAGAALRSSRTFDQDVVEEQGRMKRAEVNAQNVSRGLGLREQELELARQAAAQKKEAANIRVEEILEEEKLAYDTWKDSTPSADRPDNPPPKRHTKMQVTAYAKAEEAAAAKASAIEDPAIRQIYEANLQRIMAIPDLVERRKAIEAELKYLADGGY